MRLLCFYKAFSYNIKLIIVLLFFNPRFSSCNYHQASVSARDMSLSIGQNHGYINDIESGKSTLSLTGIIYICEYFKITPSEFFNFDSTNPIKLKPLIEKIRLLNDNQLETVSNLVNDLVKLNTQGKR